jgi:hypothetical protein
MLEDTFNGKIKMNVSYQKFAYSFALLLLLSIDICFAQNPSFEQIMAGVRPRGACKTNYDISIPMSGGKEIYVSTIGNDANQGNRQSPMATITEASKKAVAGDVITVANGVYNGGVTIHANGSLAKPVVIQAENCGGVILTSNGDQRIQAADWRGGDANSVTQTQNLYITFRGFIIRQMYTQHGSISGGTNGGEYTSFRVSNGWVVSDCVFDRNTTAMDIRADNILVVKSEFRNSGHLSILGAGNGDADPGSGWVFRDLIISGSNQNLHFIPHEASHKLLYTIDMMVDNIESYGNHGPAWWFDWHNSNFTTVNSYFHHNISDQEYWTGMGIMSEVNDGGLIEYNVFHDNEGAGVGLLESRNIEIRNNLFVNDIIEIRCMSSRGMDVNNLNIHHNYFKNSGASRWGQEPETCRALHPNQYMNFDYNTYDGLYQFRWLWHNADGDGIQGMRNNGWEANGSESFIAWPLTPDSSLWGNYQPPVEDTASVMLPADGVLQAESADQLSGLEVKPGIGLGFSNGADWAMWKNVYFDGSKTAVEIAYGTILDMEGQGIELRLNSPDGTLIAEFVVQSTGGWETFSVFTSPLSPVPMGKYDLYLVMVDNTGMDWVADVDYLKFLNQAPVANYPITELNKAQNSGFRVSFDSKSNSYLISNKSRSINVNGQLSNHKQLTDSN